MKRYWIPNEIKLPKRELQEIFLRAGKLIKKDINSKTTHSVSWTEALRENPSVRYVTQIPSPQKLFSQSGRMYKGTYFLVY